MSDFIAPWQPPLDQQQPQEESIQAPRASKLPAIRLDPLPYPSDDIARRRLIGVSPTAVHLNSNRTAKNMKQNTLRLSFPHFQVSQSTEIKPVISLKLGTLKKNPQIKTHRRQSFSVSNLQSLAKGLPADLLAKVNKLGILPQQMTTQNPNKNDEVCRFRSSTFTVRKHQREDGIRQLPPQKQHLLDHLLEARWFS